MEVDGERGAGVNWGSEGMERGRTEVRREMGKGGVRGGRGSGRIWRWKEARGGDKGGEDVGEDIEGKKEEDNAIQRGEGKETGEEGERQTYGRGRGAETRQRGDEEWRKNERERERGNGGRVS